MLQVDGFDMKIEKNNMKTFLNQLVIPAFIMLCVMWSCSSPVDEYTAITKFDTTLAESNAKGAKSVVYLTSDPSRGFSGEGYYVVYEDDSIEPLSIMNSNGKSQKIKLYSVDQIGDVLFIYPDWEDCCAAIGRANGKTEEEALLLSRLFRQILVDMKSGKVYHLPLEYDESFVVEKSIVTDRHIYAVPYDGVYASLYSKNFLLRLNLSDFSVERTATSEVPDNISPFIGEGIAIFSSKDGLVRPTELLYLQSGQMVAIKPAAASFNYWYFLDANNSLCYGYVDYENSQDCSAGRVLIDQKYKFIGFNLEMCARASGKINDRDVPSFDRIIVDGERLSDGTKVVFELVGAKSQEVPAEEVDSWYKQE